MSNNEMLIKIKKESDEIKDREAAQQKRITSYLNKEAQKIENIEKTDFIKKKCQNLIKV